EVRWQSDWFGKFSLADVIRLTSRFTVAQLLARDDFNKRFTEQRPIAVTELMYPLLQAYDSTVIQSDVEFGGIDQKFNILAGRQLQEMVGQRPQQCVMTPLLVGTDGVRKMSKSLGNYIAVAEPAKEKYGKIMSIADDLVLQYFELLTDVPDKELAGFKQDMENDAVNPMTLKKRLAREIITLLDGEPEALEAEQHFEKVHQKGEMPEEIPEYHLAHGASCVDVITVLVEKGFAKSRGEAARLVKQGAVAKDHQKLAESDRVVPVQNGTVFEVGKKRRFIRIVVDEL
ncbi:MAG: tyrosine--tRNA ligase, partial [Dehalococcoidales bacterium]|nr:tyrosine--tRNA ligase [Dehalococcoidales bacterium]